MIVENFITRKYGVLSCKTFVSASIVSRLHRLGSSCILAHRSDVQHMDKGIVHPAGAGKTVMQTCCHT